MQILLIEDNHSDASLLTDFLTEEADAPHIRWVTDGKAALEYLSGQGKHHSTSRPDIIILDLVLSRISSYDFLKQLRQEYPSIPVVVITASYSASDHKRCTELGVEAYFSKPSSLQGYEDLARHLIRREFSRLLQPMPLAAAFTQAQMTD